jgi:ferredoxin
LDFVVLVPELYAVAVAERIYSSRTYTRRMPTIEFEKDGKTETIDCERGANLRDVLLEEGLSPHNIPTVVSCHGLGTCATCSIEVLEGELKDTSMRERIRLNTPVVSPEVDARLACQVEVTEDIRVSKPEGIWGKDTD